MPISDLFTAFTQLLHSDAFLATAHHAKHPNAFTRQRKLPLPALVALVALVATML